MDESTYEYGSASGVQPAQVEVTPPHVAEDVLPEDSSAVTPPMGKKKRGWLVLLVVILIGLIAYLMVSHKLFSSTVNPTAVDKIQGKVALSEQELRDVLAANHLTAYWAGPIAGDKYSLIATNPNLIYIKYLPGGVGINDTKTAFRTVGTYVQKNAFAVGQYTGSVAGNVGMTNPDGNSVFYSSGRETNVYIGLKGKDVQIEVFDPVAGQALGLALNRNQIVPIS